MLKSSEKTGTNEYTVTVSFSAEAFNNALNKAYLRQKNRINVPGFRKGKAPRHLIERMYGEGFFYNDALDALFPAEYDSVLEETGIDPVDSPRDFEVTEVGKDGATLTFKVTVRPVIEIADYKGLSAVKPSAEVTDADVDADLEKRRENNAREMDVDDRGTQKGDIATIDFEGFVDGVAFAGGKGEDYDLELGSGSFVPGFDEQVEGHAIGGEFDVNVTFPEEYAEELAGKDAVFKVKVKGIKVKQLPELDDEFAKDVSEFDTLEELRADIRKTLTESRAASAKSTFENEIYTKLSNLVDAEIPECMIEHAIDNMISEFKYNISSQGIPFEQYLSYFGMDEDKLRETYRDRAERDVRIELALQKIADLEGIEITEEDLDAEYAAMAERYKMDVEDVKKAVAADSLTKELRARKAGELVMENAVEEEETETDAAADGEE